MSFGIIYKITNLINNKIYIGQTVRTLNARWQEHIRLSQYKNKPSYIHKAMHFYKPENFIVEQIDTADCREELDSKEKYWIKHYNSLNENFGYNLTSGGEHNKTYCKETRKRISEGVKNSKKYKEFVEKNQTLLYCFETNETMTFKQFCEKYPEKRLNQSTISFCCSGKYSTASGWHWCKADEKDTYKIKEIFDSRKPVYCIETGETFKSIAAAKKAYPNCSNLERCCKGIKNSTGGLHWCYLKDKDTYIIPKNKDKKEVYCLELNATYESAAEAARQLNLQRHSITRVCRRNKVKKQFFYTIHNYHFCFLDDKENLCL